MISKNLNFWQIPIIIKLKISIFYHPKQMIWMYLLFVAKEYKNICFSLKIRKMRQIRLYFILVFKSRCYILISTDKFGNWDLFSKIQYSTRTKSTASTELTEPVQDIRTLSRIQIDGIFQLCYRGECFAHPFEGQL